MNDKHEFCPRCNREIDPDVCWCGDSIDHSAWVGHSPIPMGCDCGRLTDEDRAGLACVPDELRGDLHEVNRLRAALHYIAYDVRCCTLDFAMAAAKSALELPWKLKNIK